MSVRPDEKSPMMRLYAPVERVVSRSIRAILAPGKSSLTRSSIFSVPYPRPVSSVLSQLGHCFGTA